MIPLAGPSEEPTPEATPVATTAPAGPIEHVVQEGDLLGRIAIRYGVTTAELAAANNIKENSVLRIGQVLVIPGTVAEPTATPAPSPTPTQASQALMESLTSIASATATPRPMATAAPRRYEYARPYLLGPISGTEISGADSPILLSWTSAGILGETEWYQLHIWTAGSGGEDVTLWTRTTSWRVPRGCTPRRAPATPSGGRSP